MTLWLRNLITNYCMRCSAVHGYMCMYVQELQRRLTQAEAENGKLAGHASADALSLEEALRRGEREKELEVQVR